MNTSLFVGLCEDAGLNVEFNNNLTTVTTFAGTPLTTINEDAEALYWIDTYGANKEQAIKVSDIAIPYALTPIEGRE